MANKTVKKKRAFREFCRNQVKAGLVNHPDGLWRPMNSTKAMDRDMRAGYKFR